MLGDLEGDHFQLHTLGIIDALIDFLFVFQEELC